MQPSQFDPSALPGALARRDAELVAWLAQSDAADAAELLSEQDWSVQLDALHALPPEQAVAVFEHLDRQAQEEILTRTDPQRIRALLERMSSDDRALLFRRLSDDVLHRALAVLAQAERDDVKRLMEFEPESAGAIMSTQYATLAPDATAAAALEHLRRIAPERETIYTVYVVDEQRRLLGSVALVNLITAPAGRSVRELMDPDAPRVEAGEDREKAVHVLAKYDLLSLPVVDSEQRLLGIVTHDDVLDVLEAEQSEDVQRASGIEPAEDDYGRSPVRSLVRRRVVWLAALTGTALLSASVIAAFEQTLASLVALAFFIPVVTGSGGNTGTQSATLIIRALATGDEKAHDVRRVLAKELAVGLCLGALLAAGLYLVGSFWPGARAVAPVVAATTVALVAWANVLGALLPLVLHRIGVDPAVAGAPLVSTIVDATGLLIYFGMARWLL